jgi:hypothetical protein
MKRYQKISRDRISAKGSVQRPAHTFTLEQIQSADEDQAGFCLACGNEQYGCEPDARRYRCEACGEKQVYGASELVFMGRVK